MVALLFPLIVLFSSVKFLAFGAVRISLLPLWLFIFVVSTLLSLSKALALFSSKISSSSYSLMLVETSSSMLSSKISS